MNLPLASELPGGLRRGSGQSVRVPDGGRPGCRGNTEVVEPVGHGAGVAGDVPVLPDPLLLSGHPHLPAPGQSHG